MDNLVVVISNIAAAACLIAWRYRGSSGLERRFYHGRGRKIDGSTPTQASLLRPRIRCFTLIILA